MDSDSIDKARMHTMENDDKFRKLALQVTSIVCVTLVLIFAQMASCEKSRIIASKGAN